jgi:hypothetical protein
MRQPGAGGGQPDDRGRAPESASFDAARVGGGRRVQPSVFVVGFLALLGGLIAVSVGGRGPASASAPPAAVASTSPSRIAPPAATPTVRPRPMPTTIDVRTEPGPVVTSPPGAIELLARRQAGAMFVHGDVFVPRVTWVYVSLQDDTGDVAGWASVSVPGAAGPGKEDGPTLRFDVELPVPERFAGRVWLSANAYDADGALIATVRLGVPAIVRPRIEFEP